MEVTQAIPNLAAGQTGGRGGTLRISQEGATQGDAQAHHGRKVYSERVPEGGPSEEAPEVPARDSGSPQDLSVPERYRAPYTQVPLHDTRKQSSQGLQTI